MKKIFALILSAILFIGCNVEIKKDSIGNPYEVMVVCSEEFWNSSAGTGRSSGFCDCSIRV